MGANSRNTRRYTKRSGKRLPQINLGCRHFRGFEWLEDRRLLSVSPAASPQEQTSTQAHFSVTGLDNAAQASYLSVSVRHGNRRSAFRRRNHRTRPGW